MMGSMQVTLNTTQHNTTVFHQLSKQQARRSAYLNLCLDEVTEG